MSSGETGRQLVKSRLLGILKGGKELVGVDNPRKDDLYRVPKRPRLVGV